jgi:hypothetical protein
MYVMDKQVTPEPYGSRQTIDSICMFQLGLRPTGKLWLRRINGFFILSHTYQKRARKALSDALRSRISVLLLKDVKRYGAIGAVDVNLRLIKVCGMWVVAADNKRICCWDLAARLDSVCPDGSKCDICKIGKTLILSIYRYFLLSLLLIYSTIHSYSNS